MMKINLFSFLLGFGGVLFWQLHWWERDFKWDYTDSCGVVDGKHVGRG